MATNKVLFNLKNVYYAITTVGDNGALTFTKPVRLPGSSKLTFELDQSQENHYSEGLVYYVSTNSSGYKGELTVFNVDAKFEEDVLGFKKDSKNVMYENIQTQPKEIALLFEIEGNSKAERHCFYRLQLTKPKYEFSTTGDKSEPVSLEFSYTGLSNEKGIGRIKTNAETDQEVYAGWFSNVYQLTEE